MARNSKRSVRDRRDTARIANTRRRPDVLPVPYSPTLMIFEDRRRWHPERPYAPARSFSKSLHRLKVASPDRRRVGRSRLPNLWSGFTSRIAFQGPSSTLVCVRRTMRREVLFARNKAGRAGQRRPRFNQFSKVSCGRRRRGA